MYILRFAQLSVYVKERSEFLIYGGSDISGLFSNVLLLCTVNSEGTYVYMYIFTIHTNISMHALSLYVLCIIPICKHIGIILKNKID